MIVTVTATNGKHRVVRHTFLQHGLTVSLGWRKSLASRNSPKSGHVADTKTKQATDKFMVFGDKVHEIHTVIVHRFNMGDVEDPDLYAAEPLWQWQQSEIGKWVMERAVVTPEWHRQHDAMMWGYNYAIVAKLKDIDYTFWVLKWMDSVVDKRV